MDRDIFKIGEFSKLTQVSIRMLRYYDETGLLKPAEIDKFTGYRLYSSNQIPVLNKIIFLRDAGFNVTEIHLAISNWSEDYITDKLKVKYTEIEDVIKKEEEKLNKINLAIRDFQNEKIAINYNVVIKSIPSYKVISLRKIIPNYFAEGLLWKELGRIIEINEIKIPKNEFSFAMYHDEEFKEENVDVEVCTRVDTMDEKYNEISNYCTEEIKTMACTMVYGPFENIRSAYLTFAEWLSNHNEYKMSNSPNRQICHKGPWNEENPENYLTEIQIAVEKIN